MKIWERFLLIFGIFIVFTSSKVFSDPITIQGWLHGDYIYCSDEGGDSIEGRHPDNKDFYIDGVSYTTSPALVKTSNGKAIFYPSLAGAGTHQIKYTNNTTQEITITVIVLNIPATTLLPFSSVCANAPPYSLFYTDSSNVSPKNGTFSGTGVNAFGFFDPAAAGPGTHTITYSAGISSCNSSVLRTLTVLPLPTVGINPFSPVCEGSPVIKLTQGYPAGGIYTGPGVDAAGNFDQSLIGSGSFPISYTYNNGTCSNTATRNIVVAPRPVATFSGLSDQYCPGDANVALAGSPLGSTGVFTGTGITNIGNGTATFSPVSSGPGLHQVVFIYTDINGCSDTALQNTQVGTSIFLTGLSTSYCINSSDVSISGSPTGGNYNPTAGLTDAGDGTAVFSPATAGTGMHTITYNYIDNGCTNTVSQQVRIYALPVPTFLNLAPEYCANASQLTISGNYAPGGAFSGASITDNGNGTAIFKPGNLFPGGTYGINYYFKDIISGCQATVTKQVTINPLPVATMTGDASVCTGNPATLTVALIGAAPFNIVYTDGTGSYPVNNIPGPVYTTQVYLSDTATYGMVSVSDSKGCNTTGTGSATIQAIPEVTLIAQPASQNVCEGSNVQFKVIAAGTNLQYQWEKDGVAIAGANSASLAINNAQVADGGTYHCIISGDCGPTLTSNDAMLSFWSPTTLVSNPANANECEGANISFTMQVTGSNLTWQWYRNNQKLMDTSNYAGTTTNSLFITSLTPGNAGNYHCIANGSCGSVTSLPAVLAVDRSIGITSQPANATLCSGNNVSFSVVVLGDNLSYQWQKNNLDIAGATTPALAINSISLTDAGFYRCHVQSSCGSELFSNSATLTIGTAPLVTSNPVSIVRCEGDNGIFSVTATGSALTYQWRKNGINITDNARINGSTNASLVVSSLVGTDAGTYSCVITGSCGSINSLPASLTVDTALIITVQPVDVHPCTGDNEFFSVSAIGNNVSYQWKKNNIIILGQTGNTLVINNATIADEGTYACTITNSCGKNITSDPATLNISEDITINQQPTDLIVCAGNNAPFTVQASGDGLTYQWELNGMNMSDGGNISGSNTNTLIIQNTGTGNAGVYNCNVKGYCGSERSAPASLVINDNLVILTQPSGDTICEGNNTQFRVSGNGVLGFQWQKDEIDLPGENANVLLLNNVTVADSGVYRCFLFGSCDTLVTDGALLLVKAYPLVIIHPVSYAACESQLVQLNVSGSGSYITWQWLKNGVTISNGNGISGTTTQVLQIDSAATSDIGVYSAQLNGFCGSAITNDAVLNVTPVPHIITQPQSAAICENQSVSFIVTVSENVAYQWQKDNIDIAGQTNATLTLASVNLSAQGTYRCHLSSSCSDFYTNGAMLTVIPVTAIALQPVNLTVCEDNAVNLTISATGAALSYKWKYNGTDLSDNVAVSGSARASLTISPVSIVNAGIYHCVVSGTCGNSLSNPATIFVNENLAITNQPQSKTACLGQPVSIELQASGSGIAWQWQRNGVDIPGATASVFSIPSVLQSDAGIYRCILTGTCGQVTSEGASLEVEIPPSIVTEPQPTTITCSGGDLSLNTSSQGTNLTYQWLFNGAALIDNGTVSGSTTPGLVVSPVNDSYEGIYICRVNNSCSTATTGGSQVWVNNGAVITEQPQNINTCDGEDVSLTLLAAGDGLSYQWQKESIDIPGATSPVFQIVNTVIADSGTYRCFVYSTCDTITSNAVRVYVSETVSLIVSPPAIITPCEGTMATFSVSVSGVATGYQWKKNGTNLSNDVHIAGAKSPNLQITNITVGDEGNYTCQITGYCNSVTTPVTRLDVQTSPEIVFQPADYSVLDGGNAVFSVTAAGDSLSWQWYFNNSPLTDGGGISGSQTALLSLSNVSSGRQGAYNVIIDGYCGQVTSNPASLTILASSAIATQPSGAVKCEGESISMGITTTEAGHTFQWKKNGVNLTNSVHISGAQQATLNITGLLPADAGSYNCIVDGIENSTPAQLFVNRSTRISSSTGGANYCSGEAITLVAEATGDSLEYAWFMNGALLVDDAVVSGSSTAIAGIYPSAPSHSGQYICQITGACGNATSDPEVILVSSPVSITIQPAGDTICEGQSLSIALKVTGSALSYQWLKNGVNLSDNARISGSNSTILSITGAVTGDEGAYTCIVTGICNTKYATVAYIAVIPAIAITYQPLNASRCRNDLVTFVVNTNSSSADYQWQKNGIDLSDNAQLSGSASNVLQVNNLQLTDSGVYQCIIAGSCDTLRSNTATLRVYAQPAITLQPVSDTLCEGASYTFSISATGSLITYQWMKNGQPLTEGGKYIGTRTPSLQISPVTASEAGAYHCVVSGICQTVVSSPASLTVNASTVVTVQPQGANSCSGDDLALITIASGTGNTYHWEKENIPLADGGNITGSSSQVLNITNMTPVSSGTYRCVVSGVCNTSASQPAVIAITALPVILTQPANVSVCEGTNVILQLIATGDNLIYRWKKNGTPLSDGANLIGSTTPDLYINSLTIAESGVYTCEVSNGCGIVNSSPATVTVNQKGTITVQPAVATYKCIGDAASFYVTATGNSLNYQWEYNGVALSDGGRIAGSQTRVLSVSNILPSDNGLYRCIITDNCGLTANSDPAQLTVYEPVTITSVPAGDTLCAGQSITLTITATGSNLAYQWYKNGSPVADGTDISGSTTASLILTNLGLSLSGYYSCMATGSCGSTVTAAIPLLITMPVQITDQPDNLLRCEGEMAIFSITVTGDSLTYQWQKDGTPLTDGPGINGANSTLLMLTGLTTANKGSYQCLVNGACGQISSQPAVLDVNAFPAAAGNIIGDIVVCQGATSITYIVPDILNANSYNWLLPPGMVITSGQGTREIEATFVINELGGPISVTGINSCGSGPASPILSVVANPLPTAYAGENTGICSSQATLSAYPPQPMATGSWQVINGPAIIQQPTQAQTDMKNMRLGANTVAWTVILNGCAQTDTITIFNNQLIVDAGEDTSICDHMFTFSATQPLIGTAEWSIISGAGYNISRTDPHSIVSGLAQGQNIFSWTVNNNGCISYDTVVITNNLPTESDAGPNQFINSDNTNLNANNPSTGSGKWSLLSGSATIGDRYKYNTLVTTLGKGKNIFEWMITHSGCISTDTVIIENVLTDTTDAGTNQIICSSTTRLNAKNPYPGYGEWTVKRGSATFANNNLYNTYAYNLARGENVLVWTAYLNGTTSDSVIIINDLPTTANAGVNLSICADSVNLNANLPYIGTGLWSTVSGSGVFINANSNIALVRNIAQGNNNFRWTITNGTCTSSSTVTIVNNTPTGAEAGFDVVTCEDTIVLNPNIPTFGIGSWSVISGSARFTGNVARDLSTNDNHLVYSIINAGCYSRDTMVILSHKPTIARAGADMSLCHDSALMVANIPVTGTGLWSLQSGSAAIEDITNGSTMVRNLGPGSNTFRWTITYLECSSYDDVIISNDYVAADAGADQVLCSDRTILEANDPGYSQGYWTLTGGATGATIVDPAAPNSTVQNLAKGTNILRWTISKNSCISYDEVLIVNNMPTRAFAGEDEYLCTTMVNLRAGTVLNGQGTWSILSGSGNFSDIHDPFASINNLGAGTNVLRWTTENAGCILTDEVIISNNLPVNVYAGLDQSLCADSTSLYANPPSNGTGTWSVINGSATLADNKLYNSKVNNLGNGRNILKWTVATTGCAITDTVVITNNLPTVAVAGSDFPVCNSQGNLIANTPLYGTGEWSLVSGAGIISNPGSPRTSISDMALGNNLLKWTITNQNCTASDDILITNNSPTIADAGSDAEVCGSTAILYANSPMVGYGYWEVISGTGDFADSLNYNTTISGLNFGENTLRWTTQNGNCSTIDEIAIINNISYVYAGEDQVIYEDKTILSGNNPGSGTGEWLLLAGAGAIGLPGSFTSPVTTLGAGLNTFEWTITNGSCTARDQVVINYKVMPKVGFIADKADGCPGLTVAFVNTTQYGTTYRWDMGDGTVFTDVNPSYTYNYPGEYFVRLTAFGPDNKYVSSSTLISVQRPPVADFQFAPDTAFVNKAIRCYDYSYGTSVYSWDFGDNEQSNEANPMHYYKTSGEFTITLMVASEYGCTDTISRNIVVAEDGLIIFPNAFTPNPNGSNEGYYTENDRNNDVFHPYHENVAEFHMEIYSRWGVLLFETTDVNIGWGGYYKGSLLARDVYVWKASGKYVSGSEFFKTGTVLLIK